MKRARHFRVWLGRRHFLGALGAMGGFALMPLAAMAEPRELETLRAAGAVGEAFDGYVRPRVPGAGTQEAADRINARRREIYERRAKEQKVPAAQVGRVYAEKLYERAPAGTWFLTEKGNWAQKR